MAPCSAGMHTVDPGMGDGGCIVCTRPRRRAAPCAAGLRPVARRRAFAEDVDDRDARKTLLRRLASVVISASAAAQQAADAPKAGAQTYREVRRDELVPAILTARRGSTR